MRLAPARFFLVTLASLVLALSGCGSTAPSAQDPGTGPASDAATTITHKFGTTVLPAHPTRVLTVGFDEQDFAIALGVEPVGVREFLGYDAPRRPWLPENLRGKQLPTVGAQEISFEKVAALAPDLILGINSYMSAEDYATLSRIAPTVAQSADYADGGTPWDQQTLQTGTALGRSAQAQQVVDGVRARFEALRTANPAFAGASATFLLGGDPGSVYSLSRTDYRTAWLTELGFTVPTQDATLGLERLDAADADVVLGEGLPASITGSRLWKALPAVAEQRYVDAGTFDEDFAAAVGFSSPLSLPYVLEQAGPRLVAATDGNPATAPAPITDL